MDAGGFASLSLGERMILAARLAVAAHLHQSAAPVEPAPADTASNASPRRIAIGGAGPVWIADDASSRASRLMPETHEDEHTTGRQAAD
jgi:hypothetical protein